MSREIKVCNVNTLNDVNDKVNNLKRNIKRDIANAEQKAINAAERNTRERINNAKREIERSMNHQIGNLDRKMNRQIEDIDARHRKEMQQLSSQIYDDMGSLQNWTTKEINRIEKSIDRLEQEVDDRFSNQQRQINVLNKDIQALFNRLKDEQNYMERIANATQDLFTSVEKRTLIDRFAPVQANRIRRRLSELANSDAPATSKIAIATEICNQIWEMEEDAIKAKIKHDTLVDLALEQLDTILSVINSNRIIKTNGIYNDGEVYEIETDFWTKNEYSKVRKELNDLRNLVEDRYNKSMTEGRIKEIIEQSTVLEAQGKALITQAVERGVLSENRVVITQDIISAMLDQGYMLKQEDGNDAVNYMGGEADNDMREGVYAILENGTGEEITVIVTPDESDSDNQIIFHRNDHRPITDSEYIRNLKAIQREIEKSGHKLGNLSAPSDGGNEKMPELIDGKKLSRRGTSERLRKRIK